MYNIAKASEQDRRVLFRNTAQQTGLHEAIIEKDFWVCLTLDHLFTVPGRRPSHSKEAPVSPNAMG